MPLTLYLDAETASPIDLANVGARTYAESDRTRVLCWSYAIGDGPTRVWWSGETLPPDLAAAVAAGCRTVAHNVGFDATVYDHRMVPLGWPAIPFARWSCTAFRCRLERLPASLEKAAEVLSLPPKDQAGRKFILSLSKRDLDAKPLTAEECLRADAYVRQDVELCRMLNRRLPRSPSPGASCSTSTTR